MNTPSASNIAADLRAGFERAAAALGSALDVEQGPVAAALADLGAQLAYPPRTR